MRIVLFPTSIELRLYNPTGALWFIWVGNQVTLTGDVKNRTRARQLVVLSRTERILEFAYKREDLH